MTLMILLILCSFFFGYFCLYEFPLSIMFIPDCQLTAFILDTAWVLIKDTWARLCLSFSSSLCFSFSVCFSLHLFPLFRSWCRLSFRGTGWVLCAICLHIVLAIFCLPGLWQDHLPSVICGQGQIKWHGVVPAGSVVPPKLLRAKNWPVIHGGGWRNDGRVTCNYHATW